MWQLRKTAANVISKRCTCCSALWRAAKSSIVPSLCPRLSCSESLQAAPLPTRTHALLMQHYERTGEFAKAEDALFAMLDAEPDNQAIVEFGITFFQRLLAQSDAALNEANLPRAEVEEGLKELQRRQK